MKNAVGNAVPNAVTDAERTPWVTVTPTRPDPTRPDPTRPEVLVCGSVGFKTKPTVTRARPLGLG